MAMEVDVFLDLLVIPIILSTLLSSHHYAKASNEIGKPLIAKTCTQTEFPDVCTSVLESDPRSSSANLAGLSGIGLEVTATKANETAPVAYKLMNSAKDYAKWSTRSTCIQAFNINDYRVNGEGLKYFDAKKFDKAYEIVDIVNGELQYCSTLVIAELTESSTLLAKFTTDLKTILHQL